MRKPDILTGYRALCPNYGVCAASVFRLHNQTLNIFSAAFCVVINVLMGAAQWRAWLAIDARMVEDGFETATHTGQAASRQWVGSGAVPVSIYGWLLAHTVLRVLCWLASVGWHTLESHSPAVADLWCSLDYLGIYTSFIGMGGNCVNALCLGTCAAPATRLALLGWGTLCAVAAIGASCTELFRRDGRVSGGCFALVMFSYMVPIAVLGAGLPGSPLRFLAWSCSCAAVGGLCWFVRVPERFVKRNWLDVAAPSHSLWHWSNVPHDFFVLCFTWELSTLALRQGFACPVAPHSIASSVADALGFWY